MYKILIVFSALVFHITAIGQTVEEFLQKGDVKVIKGPIDSTELMPLPFKGNSKADLKDYPGDISNYIIAIRKDSADAESLFNRGNAKFQPEIQAGAVGNFSKAIVINNQEENHYQESIANSIDDFINIWAPVFSTKYVKSDNGNDLQYTVYLKTEIQKSKAKGHEYFLATALGAFSSLIASASKEEAKEYAKVNNNDTILEEYRRLLFLSPNNSKSREDYIYIYLYSASAVQFHLKIKGIPANKYLENLFQIYLEDFEINQRTFKKDIAYKINYFQCMQFLAISLENYAKTLTIGFLKRDISEFPFGKLQSRRAMVVPQSNNFDELYKKISLLDEADYNLRMVETGDIIVGYFSIINGTLRELLKSQPM